MERKDGRRPNSSTGAQLRARQEDCARPQNRILTDDNGNRLRSLLPIADRVMKMVVQDLAERSDPRAPSHPHESRRLDRGPAFDADLVLDPELPLFVRAQLDGRRLPDQANPAADVKPARARRPDRALHEDIALQLYAPRCGERPEPEQSDHDSAHRHTWETGRSDLPAVAGMISSCHGTFTALRRSTKVIVAAWGRSSGPFWASWYSVRRL